MVLHLDAERRSVTFARRWVSRQAVEAGIGSEARAVIELLTSELVANALDHAPAGGLITVETTVLDDAFHVAVTDEGDGRPVVRDPPATATGGRGMMLVDLLSRSWGATPVETGGKSVWFTVAL